MLFLFIFSSATTGGKSEACIASFRLSKEMTYCRLPILYELFYSSVQFVFGSFLTTSCFSFNQFAGCIRVHPGKPETLTNTISLLPWLNTCYCVPGPVCVCMSLHSQYCFFCYEMQKYNVARQYNMCMTSQNVWYNSK